MKKKWMLTPQELWNAPSVEQWLEDEALRGWRLVDSGSWFAVLEQREPARCRVRLEPWGQESQEALEERIAVYEEMGWVYADTLSDGQKYMVYYCDDPAAAELQSDPVVQRWAWEKSLKRSWREGWILLLMELVLGPLLFIAPLRWEAPVRRLLDSGTPMLYAALVLLPWLLFCVIRRLHTVARIRRLLSAGVAPAPDGSWRKDRCRWRLGTVLILGYWVLAIIYPFYQIATSDSFLLSGGPPVYDVFQGYEVLEAGEAPYIPTEELDPGLDSAERHYGLATYDTALLAPERWEIEETYSDQRLAETCLDRLRFPFLAELLYEERQAEFLGRAQWSTKTPVEAPAFDEACLMELPGGEVQMFLARRDKVVFSVLVNFGADLSAHVDAFAAVVTDWPVK